VILFTRFFLLTALLACAAPLPASGAAARLFTRTFLSPADQAPRSYDVRTPAGYDASSPRPAVLFLHGRGGSKGSFQTDGYAAEADARGVILIFWQGRPTRDGLFATYYVDGVNGFPDETDVLACLDDALASFAIDRDRVHVAGFSQGGRGALLVGLKNPDRFASIIDGAGPSDAFQGQLFAPTFPDYREAAGGDAAGATGAVLARWYALSPRFLLANASRLPIALFHGQLDDVVPDSTSLFPYRNTHHVADTPGFRDARGQWPTLKELDSPFEAFYPLAGHDEEAVLKPKALFDWISGKVRDLRPGVVRLVTWDEKERGGYGVTLRKALPADGTPSGVETRLEAETNSLDVTATGEPAAALDLARLGLVTARPARVLVRGTLLGLRLILPSPPRNVYRDGRLLDAGDYERRADGLAFVRLDGGAGTVLTLEPAPAETDLLVPAFVRASGQNGARFETEVAVANIGSEPVTFSWQVLGALPEAASRQTLAPGTTFAIRSSPESATVAAPMTLHVEKGPREALAATSRVYNALPAGGTYGLSFPVRTAGESVVPAGERAFLFAGVDTEGVRVNLSLFAPFEASAATVTVIDGNITPVKTENVSLRAGERRQLDDLTRGVTPPAKMVMATIEGRVQAYGTVVSNSATNDPYRSPALLVAENATHWTVPAVAAVRGRGGVPFSSDILVAPIYDTQDFVIPITLTFRPLGGGPTLTKSLPMLPGSVRPFADVVRSVFPEAGEAAGALELDSVYGFVALAVTRSEPETGPSFQDVTCVARGREITSTSPVAFVGLTEDDGARSNLVLTNQGPATRVTLTLLTEDGPGGSLDVPLDEGAVTQLNAVLRSFTSRPVSLGALVVRPAEGGVVVASAVRIDNLTNDPAGVAAVGVR